MNDNLVFLKTYRKIIRIAWIVMISLSIISYLISIVFFKNFDWYMFPLSFLLGAMTNIFAFNLLKNNVANITDDVKSAISGSFSNYAVRLMIYAFVFMISLKNFQSGNAKLNPILVVAGFFTVRIAIYIYSWSNRKQ